MLLGESYVNTRQTHSQTLLPMVEQLLAALGKQVKDFQRLAVSAGPGSFTGVRIGVACLKGLAFPENLPLLRRLHPGGHRLRGPGQRGLGALRRDGRPVRPGVQRPVP